MNNELVIHTKPKSSVSEDIRTIRTNLQFISSNQDSKVILIASSVPGEGKSFISSNLATAFAQTGKSTLLVDCDMRLGRTHKIFGISNSEGLSNLLIEPNLNDWKNYIQKTSIRNLYVITRGVVPPNPSELLNSENAKKLISKFRECYDYVILDGVPVNGLPDSLIMAGLADRVVLVASEKLTNIDDLVKAKKALENVDANIAGVVVNRTKGTKRGKYSNYYE